MTERDFFKFKQIINDYLIKFGQYDASLYDEDFNPYNANHDSIRRVYSSISKSESLFFELGYSLGKDFYGQAQKNASPYLFNGFEKIVFFRDKNNLKTKHISDEIDKASNCYRLIAILFDTENNQISNFVAKEYKKGIWCLLSF